MTKRVGNQTIMFSDNIYVAGRGNVAGTKEGDGPLKEHFDCIMHDAEWGEKTWEKTESKMQKFAAEHAVHKAGIAFSDLDYIFAGDLLNQCIAAGFAFRDANVPFFGVYGACSTMAESLSLASMSVDGGFSENSLAVTSSHFCTAERQYRNPLEYGGQRTPTAQWTVTGSGAVVVSKNIKSTIRVEGITTGKIVDLGIKDANNMGAAMAPAAVSTIKAHFKDTKREPDFYDLVVTGDLGTLGSEILVDMLIDEGIDISEKHKDCGCMIFDLERQDMHAGGSGCGCGAVTLTGYIMDRMEKRELKKVLFVATGALLSPTSTLQGESIPSIAHAVILSSEEE